MLLIAEEFGYLGWKQRASAKEKLVADEFVDLYETLDLPIDTDRNTVRKRISELYTEAQRNLDHRNFQTRVKYQELFEIILPQARYILLDEGRRDQYDALVRSTRAPKNSALTEGAATPPPAAQASSFKLKAEEGIPGQTPTIEPIPSASMPQITPEQRDEQWKKWKSGLAEVLEREERHEVRPKTKPSLPPPVTGSGDTPPKKESKPRPVINFDFGDEADAPKRGESAPVPGAEELVEEAKARLDPKEAERRRTEHRRELMKEILVGEGIKGMALGATAIAVPGAIAMVVFMSRYYKRGAAPTFPIAIPEGLMWLIWMLLLSVIGFFTARAVSKSMRKKRAADLAKLSYDDIVKLGRRPL